MEGDNIGSHLGEHICNTYNLQNTSIQNVYNPEYTKDSYESVRRRQPIDIWSKAFKWHFTQKSRYPRNMKTSSAILVMGKWGKKTSKRHYSISPRFVRMKGSNGCFADDVEQYELLEKVFNYVYGCAGS